MAIFIADEERIEINHIASDRMVLPAEQYAPPAGYPGSPGLVRYEQCARYSCPLMYCTGVMGFLPSVKN